MVRDTEVQAKVESYQRLKKKIELKAPLLNTQHYKVQVKCKSSNSWKRVTPSPTSQWGSYWKVSFFGHPYLQSDRLLILFYFSLIYLNYELLK